MHRLGAEDAAVGLAPVGGAHARPATPAFLRAVGDDVGHVDATVSDLPAVTYVCDPDPLWTCRSVTGGSGRLPALEPSRWTDAPHLWLERVHPADRERLISERMRAVETHSTLSCDYRMQTGDGETVWVHDEAAIGEDGHVHGLLLDTTRQHQLEDVLRRLHDAAASEVTRLRGERERRDVLFRTIVHDIRSVLVGIGTVARAETIDRDRLGETVDRAMALTTSILDLEGGAELSMPRTVDLGQLLATIVSEVDAGDHPVRVDGAGLRARVAPTIVRRVVTNLVSNAVAHTPAGTPIRVQASGTSRGVLIAVEDDGPGIDDALHERVFEPSYRGGDSDGSGMGLNLVRRLVELHGGQIWAESPPGGGTAFLVVFPD